jgi:hypothetical protein
VTSVGVTITLPILGNDSDPDGDALTLVSVGQAANGTVVLNADGSVSYTPDAGFSGTDTFTYLVVDASGSTATGTVVVEVAASDEVGSADDSVALPPTEVLGASEISVAGVFVGQPLTLSVAAGSCSSDVEIAIDGVVAATAPADGSPIALPTDGIDIGMHDARVTCAVTGEVLTSTTFNSVRQRQGGGGGAQNSASVMVSALFVLVGMSLFVSESQTRTSG